MSGKRFVWLVPALGLLGSQAGHVVAYELRFGGFAQQAQSTGAHSYFPATAKTGLGAVALTLLVALLVVGAARLATGRPIEPDAAPSLVRMVAALYTIQLAVFAVQEAAEALAGGGPVMPAPTLLLFGTAGQLPVAVVAALALRWLGVRLRPALAAIAVRVGAIHRRHEYVVTLGAWPLATEAPAVRDAMAAGSNRRGPPSF